MVVFVKTHPAHLGKDVHTGRRSQYHPLEPGNGEIHPGETSGPVASKMATDVGHRW